MSTTRTSRSPTRNPGRSVFNVSWTRTRSSKRAMWARAICGAGRPTISTRTRTISSRTGCLTSSSWRRPTCSANIAAGRGNTFAYTGAPGTSPLPIALAYFRGTPAAQANNPALYTSNNFTSATFVNTLALNNPNVCCGNHQLFRRAGQQCDLPRQCDNCGTCRQTSCSTNPGLRGGANFTGNGGYTRYDALQLDLRRRLSNGLLVQANYQFAKELQLGSGFVPRAASQRSRYDYPAARLQGQLGLRTAHRTRQAAPGWGWRLA